MAAPKPAQAKNFDHLCELIRIHTQEHGNRCSLNHIDVSEINDMSCLFQGSSFNGDISQWDVSHVVFMSRMFEKSSFQGDISQWNTSKVTFMDSMFDHSKFNGDLSNWNTANVKNMSHMFANSVFNGDISRWNTSNVLIMNGMFMASKFNGDVSSWDVSNVMHMAFMFFKSTFQGDLSSWDFKALDLVSGASAMFATFHDSPLGYLAILSDAASFPKKDPRAAQFELLRAICDGLNMHPMSAARHIYKALHSPTSGPSEIMDHTLPVDFDIQATGSMP